MSSYDRFPVVHITGDASPCFEGWDAILDRLSRHTATGGRTVIAVEIYPGIEVEQFTHYLSAGLQPAVVLRSEEAFLNPDDLRAKFAESLREDPVFDFMYPWTIEAYFDPVKLQAQRDVIARSEGTILVVGTGASWVAEEPNLLLSANLGRWEIQGRQRAHLAGNLGFKNPEALPGELYKTAFF